ncbi:hypothetical protein C2G38_2178242 [Gigaspora rosea]|uniref:Uncharacterized protein n=1 Tax=Gigaspora rosea TaxID=44941 RepID=A0A397VIN6_9GLOM|nr:hypothetical protein C2G38_2178242 [Gigaspora rosea]
MNQHQNVSKEDSKDKALQQLYWLHPDFNSRSVWVFPTFKKSAEGRILYEKTEKHSYVYDTITQKRFSFFLAWMKALSGQSFFKGKTSALATIFLKPDCNKMNIGRIIKGKNYLSYFKNIQIATLSSIKDTLTTMIYDDVELIGPENNHKIIANLENKGLDNEEKLIESIRDHLKLKFEAEKEQVSEPLTELFTTLLKFIRWAISIYSRSPAAYKTMKSVIRMLSISTLKSYINETEQHTGLLWNQRYNRYVGYIDFDNENEAFSEQCFYNIQASSNHIKYNNDEKDRERTLATQIYQILSGTSQTYSFSRSALRPPMAEK